jgi:hypothetical protein
VLPRVAAAEGTAAVLAGKCPDPAIEAALDRRLLRSGDDRLIPHSRVTAAVARVRAERALAEARELYTRTNFSGCISLLSISELELARSLAEPEPALRQRAHGLLARVMLWLGICQWASGEPQAAATSFVRSAQLPASPQPDPKLLPPELVAAYRSAVAEPRTQVTCTLDAPLSARDVQVDGKGPTVTNGDKITVPTGSHYLVLRVGCKGDPKCEALGGMRALRLEAAPERCRIQVPAVHAAARLTCVNLTEAGDASFAASVTREARARQTLVIAVSTGGGVNLRLHRGETGAGYAHQLVSTPGKGETIAQVVGRGAPLLLGRAPGPVEPPPPPPNGTDDDRWYRKWWIWAIAGGAAAIIITSAAVAATRDDRVRVIFGR